MSGMKFTEAHDWVRHEGDDVVTVGITDYAQDQLANGATRKRVGLRPEGRAPVREGARLLDENGNQTGVVTSGAFAATVGGPIAMGYVASADAEVGRTLQAEVRGKLHPVTVAKLPFVEQRYYRG